jgi:HK97 family phage portal protein
MVSLPRIRVRAGIPTRILTATDGRDIVADNTPAGWEVNQPWLWFTGNASDNVFGNPPPGALTFGGDGPLGRSSLPAVSRCTSIICDTIAGMPWQVFRGWDKLDTPTWISDPQLTRQDGRVNAAAMDTVKLSAVEFWAQWIVSALWLGDGYVWVPVRDASGQPVAPLWILHPSKVSIDNDRYYISGTDYELAQDEILHLRGEPPYIDGYGMGVLTRHGPDLGLALTVRQYASSQYQSGIPYGYLKSQQPKMTGEQATALKEGWLSAHGTPQRNIAVLNATTEFTPLAISPLDAQLNQAREWSLRDIAMAFGIPSYMLGVAGDSSTYSNVESRMIELRQFSLLPWIRRIESCLDSEFPRGTDLHINSDSLLRADTLSRYNAYKVAIDSGVMTKDEAREKENLPPLGVAADSNIPDDTPQPVPNAFDNTGNEQPAANSDNTVIQFAK